MKEIMIKYIGILEIKCKQNDLIRDNKCKQNDLIRNNKNALIRYNIGKY